MKRFIMLIVALGLGWGSAIASPLYPLDSRWDCKTPYFPLGQQSGWNNCNEIAPAPKKVAAAPVAVASVVDSDKDGIQDSADKCPGTPGGVQVDTKGCPTDADRDGVGDYKDECQGTPEGTAVDTVGCPQTAKAIGATWVLPGVQFEQGSDKIKSDSVKVLDDAADILKTRTSVRVEIQGHTDNVGETAANSALSQRRADSVKAYLVKKGIAADRMQTKGYGQTMPVADNATDAGRAQNRRIEFKVLSR